MVMFGKRGEEVERESEKSGIVWMKRKGEKYCIEGV
jgi:hypothetical protein